MKMNTRIAKGAALVALVALVSLPLSAWAVSGKGGGPVVKGNSATHAPKASNSPKAPKVNASRSATAAAKLAGKHAALHSRIAKMLANRERAFDNAASKISVRIERVASVTATVALAGDVSDIPAQLQEARDKVAAAQVTEEAAVAMFKAVPDTTTDRKAAFAAAKAMARSARAQLSEARATLRNAILALKVVINGLVPAPTS